MSPNSGLPGDVASSENHKWTSFWSSEDSAWRAMAITMCVGLAVVLITSLRLPPAAGWLDAMELRLQDYFCEIKEHFPTQDKRLQDEVILVCMDPESRRRLGLDNKSAWPRSILALLVKKLSDAGADVIAINATLDGPTAVKSNEELAKICSLPGMDSLGIEQNDDNYLLEQLKKSKNIVLASNVHMLDAEAQAGGHTEVFQSPFAPFIEALGIDSGSVGNSIVPLDRDGLVRRSALVFEEFNPSGIFYKSFALRIAEKKLGSRALPADSPEQVYLRKKIFPNMFRINYVGAPGSFKMIPLWRALDWQKHYAHHGLFLPAAGGKGQADERSVAGAIIEDNPFRNRIVIVGPLGDLAQSNFSHIGKRNGGQVYSSAESFYTPVSSTGPMSAIEVQGNVVSNLLHDRYLSETKEWQLLLIVGGIVLLFGRLLGKLPGRPWLTGSILGAFSLLWLGASFIAFTSFHALIPVVVPLLAVAFPAWLIVTIDEYALVKREKLRRIRVFRSLAARPLAEEIERKLLAELGLEGKRMTVTLLACQIRGFANDLDQESPEAVMERLNKTLGVMMAAIGEHHGMVERIWNCGVIGLFGAPIAMPEAVQAKRAAECALDIRKRLQSMQADQDGQGVILDANFTCGINTGEAICGTINATAKDSSLTQYGALGAAVDLAVELETLNGTYGTNFIVGSTTAALLGNQMEVREVDRLKLNQGKELQSVFELLPWEGSLPGVLEEAMALFKQGRSEMEEGRLKEAEKLFVNSLRMVPHDRPTMLMLERCREQLGMAGSHQAGTAELLREKLTLKDRLDGPH